MASVQLHLLNHVKDAHSASANEHKMQTFEF